MTGQDGERAAGRSAETRRRHGEDFYARIGRKGWEERRRARAGDADARDTLQRRREARTRRRAVWQELVEAQGAVALLRAELRNQAAGGFLATQGAWAQHFRYGDRLREELAQAEERLERLRAAHRAILDTLQSGPEAGGAP